MEEKKRRIVVDTNVLISSLINPQSIIWEILDIESVDFLVPEMALDELAEYELLIKKKLRKKGRREAYEFLVSELFKNIIVVPTSAYKTKIKEAYTIMKTIDEKDTEFLALAMEFSALLLSNDRGFKKQGIVNAYSVKEFVNKLFKS